MAATADAPGTGLAVHGGRAQCDVAGGQPMTSSPKAGGTGTARSLASGGRFPALHSGAGPAFQHRSLLELGALPGAVPCGRGHARNLLREWHLQALAATTELIVSELLTNAIAASRRLGGPVPSPVCLLIESDRQRALITVWDANPEMPVRQEGALDAESGRGLFLVSVLAAQWGMYAFHDGKAVWAVVEE